MKVPLPKGDKKLLNAWAFYDWANSVYSLTIVSAVFPIFYGVLFEKGESVSILGTTIRSTPLITYATALGFIIVAVTSPFLSGIADHIGNKKNFMKFFNYLGAASCIGLFWFTKETIYTGLLFYILALVGFWGSIVFYNSYLPDIAFEEQQDAVSAKGYSLGYLGSVLLLALNLTMVLYYETFGFENAIISMRYSFLLVGVWWIGFSQYTYYYLPKGFKKEQEVTNSLWNGYKELQKVWKNLSTQTALKRYLGAFFVYSMAVQTVMLVATYFGEQEIDWGGDDQKTMGLIISILVIQLVAILGAVLTSKASAKFGNVKTLIGLNFIWAFVCLYAYFVTTSTQFYATAAVVGLVMGGIQALSRSTYAKFLPETQDTTSYFSFFDVAEKIGIVIGMAIFATVDVLTDSMRYAVLLLFLFFIIGIILLLRVLKIVPQQS
ncbi:MFS transporter [Aquimarina sp. ERC-38]|uniref:MFS transporter n=1 Tax=Aquimarina sp. ERC-38 TaxID=2949996 RepID=UPI002245FB64|nr:MFS transporter [Aquimarina sp. ERC-38]UZO80117.1 MFS transporter [Aquimarina sp. ERC-38]